WTCAPPSDGSLPCARAFCCQAGAGASREGAVEHVSAPQIKTVGARGCVVYMAVSPLGYTEDEGSPVDLSGITGNAGAKAVLHEGSPARRQSCTKAVLHEGAARAW
ncbi:hypothetical protein ACWKSP_17715, partial [Micromonosporaceae bacterium Da 78-11]